MEVLALANVLAKLNEAGGFGDGIDFGSFRPLDVLSRIGISEEEREAASLVLLCELVEAVDNSTWKDAVQSALGQNVTNLLGDRRGAVAHEDAVQAFFGGESEFYSALEAVFAQVSGSRNVV